MLITKDPLQLHLMTRLVKIKLNKIYKHTVAVEIIVLKNVVLFILLENLKCEIKKETLLTLF